MKKLLEGAVIVLTCPVFALGFLCGIMGVWFEAGIDAAREVE